MPCFCWMDDSEIEPEMKLIRLHVKYIVAQMNIIHSKGHLYPKKGSLPRHIMDDVKCLLDDIWSGKCSETGNKLDAVTGTIGCG